MQGDPSGSSVLVLNEGLFRRGNATISGYDAESNTSLGTIYDPSNSQLGGLDVLQSATVLGDTLVLVANNSNALVLLDAENLEELSRFPALGSPRYLTRMENGQLLVTDLFANRLLELNPDFSQARIIRHEGQAEAIIPFADGALFVSPSRRAIFYYDATLGEVIDSMMLSFRANDLLALDDTRIAVCGGILEQGESGGLIVLNWAEKALEYSLGFSESESSLYPRIDVSNDHLFCLQKTLISLPLDNIEGLGDFQVPLTGFSDPYGLGVDPINGDVYVADAFNGLGLGRVVRYNPEGRPVDTINVGVFPNGFIFR